MEHLTLEKYLYIIGKTSDVQNTSYKYVNLYYKIIETWESPIDWIDDNNKTFRYQYYSTNSYWFAWSMHYSYKLPASFINSVRMSTSSLNILKNTLTDYDILDKSLNEMILYWTKETMKETIPKLLLLLTFLGKNSIADITLEDIQEAAGAGVLKTDKYISRLTNLIKFINQENEPEFKYHLERQLRDYKFINKKMWTDELGSTIEESIRDTQRKSNNYDKAYMDKKAHLECFSKWYIEKNEIDIIQDFYEMDRAMWLDYINYIIEIKGISNKTKFHKLSAIKTFINWADLKKNGLIFNVNGKFVFSGDLKSISNDENKETLSFESRKDAEKILKYLIYDFKTDDIKQKYYRELIIIIANSGARISEIKFLEFNSVFYSEDEKLYKTKIEYSDKLKQINRPIYFTFDGFKAIKRVEKLRLESGKLINRYDERTKKEYIRLFEHNGSSGFLKTSFYNFLNKIKRKLGLIDEDGKPRKGGAHAYRHFFAMTIFIESNYNISAVRYLLGHRSYQMTIKYLEEEKLKVANLIRDNNNDDAKMKITGKGLDTFLDIIMNNNKNNIKINGVIDNNPSLCELIKNKHIKSVSIGYCLNPCQKSDCIGCNNHLITNEDENQLIKSTNELFELLCYQISVFGDQSAALENINVQKQLDNLIILIGELKVLEIDMNKLSADIKELILCIA